MEDTKTASYVIPIWMHARIRKIADREGVTQSKVMRDIIAMSIEHRENMGLPKLHVDE